LVTPNLSVARQAILQEFNVQWVEMDAETAPVGYLNTRDFTEGKDVRYIKVDDERAPLVRWAFEGLTDG
jgi:hypothetical protein